MKSIVCITVLTLWLSNAVHAHPHVFVDAQAGFQVDERQRLQSLSISWQYDAFTTLFLFDTLDLDSDSKGQLNPTDRAAIVAAETDWPPGYDGDVHLVVGGETQQMGQPHNATADLIDGRIIVRFDLPLVTPVNVSEQQASLRLYDPAYYYAYSVNVNPARQPMTEACETVAIPFEPDAADAETLVTLATLSREETPNDSNIGARFADEIVLTCH